jgi:hypothetical protein
MIPGFEGARRVYAVTVTGSDEDNHGKRNI